MGKPKFTEGPWRAGKNPCMTTVLNEHEGKAIYPEEGCHHIAWANALTEDGDLAMDTALANAALIAAAPEMYAMLETLLNDYEEGSIVHGQISALLAKARGE